MREEGIMGMNKRTIVTSEVLKVIAHVLDQQDAKGEKKYGRTLDVTPLDSYDWNLMAMEEMADGLKYLLMENVKLMNEVDRLTKLLEFKQGNIERLFNLKEQYRQELSRYKQIWTNEGDL
jgi:hypothetical protein